MEQIIIRRPIRSVCVYCGSGKGIDRRFAKTARSLGRLVAESGLRLVYGGGGAGLMGETARSALANGGQVTGIIPESLISLEHPMDNLTELVVVQNLHERKMLMYERSDAFIALPGGLGTLEEVIEQLTWAQLGHHDKPIIIINTAGYWNLLLDLLKKMRRETFIRPGLDPEFSVTRTAEGAVSILRAHRVLEPPEGAAIPSVSDFV